MDADVATALLRVPAQTLGRATRVDFGRVWASAEALNTAPGLEDYYIAGVVRTLRWLARRGHRTPVTRVVRSAMPEVNEAEYMAALAASRSSRLHPMRVGIARGTVAVLGWLYHGQPEPDLPALSDAS